jgi:hypothetical protein
MRTVARVFGSFAGVLARVGEERDDVWRQRIEKAPARNGRKAALDVYLHGRRLSHHADPRWSDRIEETRHSRIPVAVQLKGNSLDSVAGIYTRGDELDSRRLHRFPNSGNQ